MKVNELHAVKNNVIVEPLRSDITEGGIHIPETAQNKDPQILCNVISVGPTAAKEIQQAKKLICHPNGGFAIYVENRIIRVLKDDEVYAVVKDKDAILEENEQLEKAKQEVRITREKIMDELGKKFK